MNQGLLNLPPVFQPPGRLLNVRNVLSGTSLQLHSQSRVQVAYLVGGGGGAYSTVTASQTNGGGWGGRGWSYLTLAGGATLYYSIGAAGTNGAPGTNGGTTTLGLNAEYGRCTGGNNASSGTNRGTNGTATNVTAAETPANATLMPVIGFANWIFAGNGNLPAVGFAGQPGNAAADSGSVTYVNSAGQGCIVLYEYA